MLLASILRMETLSRVEKLEREVIVRQNAVKCCRNMQVQY